MQFEDLVGEHELSGVDFGELPPVSGVRWEAANSMTFVLDGRAFLATEDPSDGYRSCLAEFIEVPDTVKNRFQPCRVLARYRTEGSYGTDDVLECIDLVTGKVVLEVGTSNAYDYYTSYVAKFKPENMAINQSSGLDGTTEHAALRAAGAPQAWQQSNRNSLGLQSGAMSPYAQLSTGILPLPASPPPVEGAVLAQTDLTYDGCFG